MPTAFRLVALSPLLLAACANPGPAPSAGGYSQGPLEPQAVSGPCQVGRFFFLGQRSVPTQLAVGNAGAPCTVTLLNSAQQIVVNAALVTGQPAHGRAAAQGTANRQVVVTYAPQPGYVGPDRFDITLEPGAFGVTFNVTVQPSR